MSQKPHDNPYEPRTEKRENGIKRDIFPPMGCLKNGNPAGNPNNAPRCGAKRRGKEELCKAPAMANGRCRLHGGKSTGPRTAEGLARSQRGNWKHGEYSQENKEELRTLKIGMACLLSAEKLFNMSDEEIDEHRATLERIRQKLKLGVTTPYPSGGKAIEAKPK